MDLAKFEWLVTKRALYFRRADLFPDPLEGTLPSANRRIGRFFGFPMDPDSETGREFNQHKERIWAQFRRWMYVNCWHRGVEPSEDMWERYGAGGTGVAICSSFARQVLAIHSSQRIIHISDVEYLDPDEAPVHERSLAAALVRKARSYSTENEVRMFTSKVPLGSEATIWDEPESDHVSVPVNLSHLISRVAFGPHTTAATREHVKLILPWGGLTVTHEVSCAPAL